MELLLLYYIYLPLAAFFTSLCIPAKKEKIISTIAIGTMVLHLAGILGFIVLWASNGFTTVDLKHVVLFKADHFEFFVNFYFDGITAVYALVGAVIMTLVTIFSRFYMHRDEGFKRFFNTLLFFYLGYSLVIFSGNFETLFIGWEILGITSFLLIAFYRDRYLPVKNALKVISLYRVGDVCLILAMWMAHHLFQKNVTFTEMNDATFMQPFLQGDYGGLVFIAIMILTAAAAKSAQLPFSSWLPRAMEGPTTSSAIFYGSLSVHLGIFLLLRTYPLWHEIFLIKLLIILMGASTSILASGIAKVQSTVKTQIAYSSITQIGIICIEVALGFHVLALVHFTGNAFLRTYQLLVSPSVLSYLIHDQFYNFTPRTHLTNNSFFTKIKNTVYILSLKEWNLDAMLYHFVWSPFKWLGKKLFFLDTLSSRLAGGILLAGGLAVLWTGTSISPAIYQSLPVIYAVIALMIIIKAFSERGDALRAWTYIFASQLFVMLSVSLNEQVAADQVIFYFSGIVTCFVAGYFCLRQLKKIDNDILLDRFHGYGYEQPGISFVFLVSCLGLLGFPFTPTFIGIDLLFTHLHTDQVFLVVCITIGFLVIELSVLRIYARIFLGQHKKVYHPVAYRSS